MDRDDRDSLEARTAARRAVLASTQRKPRAVVPLADALDRYLARKGLDERLEQVGVIAAWPELVGPQIAAVTRADSVTPDGVLRVAVSTAAWANELSLMSPRILAKLNAGRQGRIREIRWFAGQAIPRP